MTPLTVFIGALVLGLLMFGFVWGAPIFAVPLAIIVIVAIGVLNVARRRGTELGDMRRFRGQARRASPGRDVEPTGRTPDSYSS